MKQQYVRTHSQAMPHSQAIESEDDYDKSFDDNHKSLDDYDKGLSKLFNRVLRKTPNFKMLWMPRRPIGLSPALLSNGSVAG